MLRTETLTHRSAGLLESKAAAGRMPRHTTLSATLLDTQLLPASKGSYTQERQDETVSFMRGVQSTLSTYIHRLVYYRIAPDSDVFVQNYFRTLSYTVDSALSDLSKAVRKFCVETIRVPAVRSLLAHVRVFLSCTKMTHRSVYEILRVPRFPARLSTWL